MENGLAAWHEQQGCAAGEPSWVDDGETVSRTVAACDRGSEVAAYRVEGLRHAWPASVVPGTTTSETIWDFTAHRRTG